MITLIQINGPEFVWGLLASGFASARLRFRGRKTLFWIILATMSFPTVSPSRAPGTSISGRSSCWRSRRKAIAAGIAMFADAEGRQRLWGPLISTSFLSALPVLLLSLAAQRFITEPFAPGSAEH